MFLSVYNGHTPNVMNMFSPLLRTSLLLAALSTAPLLYTACGGSGSGSVATSGAALNLDDFMSGKTYLRFHDWVFNCAPTPARSAARAREKRPARSKAGSASPAGRSVKRPSPARSNRQVPFWS